MTENTEKTKKADLPETSLFFTSDVWCNCPHCNARVDGFVANPSGLKIKCDECEEIFQIGRDIDIDYY